MLKISTQFDGGNVDIIDITDPTNMQLQLPCDNASDFKQWFYYRVQGAAYQNLTMHFSNAHESAFPGGWQHYEAMCSYDRSNWSDADLQKVEDLEAEADKASSAAYDAEQEAVANARKRLKPST